MKKIVVYTVLLLLSALSGCTKKSAETGPIIAGNLSYRAPLKLDSNTTIELRLTDVSISDGPALEVAKVVINEVRALPYQYALPYDPKLINSQHRYTVDARVSTDGQLRFATDAPYEVLTHDMAMGNGAQRDISLIAVGSSEASPPTTPTNASDVELYRNEIRTAQGVSLYQAAFNKGGIAWLEEDRSNGTPQPLHARYEFKGALVMHYRDNSPLEISFDERGKPTAIVKQQQSLKISEQAALISVVRNQAALLRSHALAAHEASAHRQATGG